MIEYIQKIDVDRYFWCKDAVLVRVVEGKAALTTVSMPCSKDDWWNENALALNGKPLLRLRFPICPTCSGLLARGYGIENADCAELREIRDQINAEFTDFQTAVRRIEPVLNLFEDGYYVIADAELYPTDGDGRFFMNVPDDLSRNTTLRNTAHNRPFSTFVSSFPAFLYPTQSNRAIDPDRVSHYLPVIDRENAPRAVAYY